MDLEACSLADMEARGLLMRLANDWGLLEGWSSARSFGRCVPRLADPFVAASDTRSLVEPAARRPEYPFTGGRAAVELDRSAAGLRGAAFRDGEGWAMVWSNLFFKSRTLVWATPA